MAEGIYTYLLYLPYARHLLLRNYDTTLLCSVDGADYSLYDDPSTIVRIALQNYIYLAFFYIIMFYWIIVQLIVWLQKTEKIDTLVNSDQ